LKSSDFGGIIAPVISPFDSNDNVDEEIFRNEVKYLLGTGIHGISPGGSTGEGAALSAKELARMVEIIKEENHSGIPIVAGVIRNCTRDAIEAGLAVKKAGADALMVTPTSYNVLVPDDDGNYEYYNKISQAVGLPIIIYNVVPQNEIKPRLFSRLLDIKNVIGIKQSVGGIDAFYKMQLACGDKGIIYSATDDMLYSTFDLGAGGAIAAILTVFPEYCVEMWNCVQKGSNKRARELQDKIHPVWQEIAGPQFPRRVKQVLRMRGRKTGLCRSPILEAPLAEQKKLEALMKNI
jgi:4-hydroxy-tetrahydrodipicolinate synthase